MQRMKLVASICFNVGLVLAVLGLFSAAFFMLATETFQWNPDNVLPCMWAIFIGVIITAIGIVGLNFGQRL